MALYCNSSLIGLYMVPNSIYRANCGPMESVKGGKLQPSSPIASLDRATASFDLHYWQCCKTGESRIQRAERRWLHALPATAWWAAILILCAMQGCCTSWKQDFRLVTTIRMKANICTTSRFNPDVSQAYAFKHRKGTWQTKMTLPGSTSVTAQNIYRLIIPLFMCRPALAHVSKIMHQ